LPLFEVDSQHCQSLVDVVVKFSSNPSAFLLLCFDQLSRHVRKSLLCQLALGDITRDSAHAQHCASRILEGRKSS
jgi:hypothetical protein